MNGTRQTSDKPHQAPSKRSLRLTFIYGGKDIRLESIKSIVMIVPNSDRLEKEENTAGFWYEVRDKENRTLYRRITDNPIKYAAEVRSDDPNAPLKWEEIKEPKGSFVLLIPDIEEGHSVVFFSSPLELMQEREKAQEIARFDITKRNQGKEAG